MDPEALERTTTREIAPRVIQWCAWAPLACLTALGVLTGCAGAPTEATPDLAAISIVGVPVRALSPGDSIALQVHGLTAMGEPAPLDGPVTWSSANPDRVTVNGRGVVQAGGVLGLTWVFAHTGTGAGPFRDSVGIWVQPREAEPSRFEIILHFDGEVPEAWRTALRIAAGRWEHVVRDTLPLVVLGDRPNFCSGVQLPQGILEGSERGIRVAVMVNTFQGTTATAAGSQCLNRGLPHPTTVLGVVYLNRARLTLDPGSLRFAAHHELGHTLGLAGAVQGHHPEWLGLSSYRGYLARFGRSLDTGGSVPTFLPISGGHWVDVYDVMGVGSGPITDGSMDGAPINNVSVGALMDLGYPAAWYGAGPLGPTGA